MALSPFAVRVRDAFLDALPHLGEFVAETEPGVLEIRIPHPRIPTGLIVSTKGDEVSIGFRTWHTHGDLLGGRTSDSQIDRSVQLVDRILNDREQIAVSHVDGKFEDAWVTDDPAGERRYVQPNEQLRIGTWSELAA